MRTVATSGLLAAAIGLAGCQAGGTAGAGPDAVAVDPGHYSVEFENDDVRLLRIRYAVGDTSVMHFHPANCAIYLTNIAANMELPDGETRQGGGRAGHVNCSDAETHKPSNVGDGPFEVILVEFKGRQTL